MARVVAEVDAACFVLDFHINVATPEELRAVYLPFYETVRAAHPDTPIVLLSQICLTREWTDPGAVAKRQGAFVDGVHPNDLGFQMMADGLAPVLRNLLVTPLL